MEKLVRDNMPELCEEKGSNGQVGWTKMNYRIAGKNERIRLLLDKLIEESKEAKEAIDLPSDNFIEELADVKEVFLELIVSLHIIDAVERARVKKRAHRGGFHKGIVWDGKK